MASKTQNPYVVSITRRYLHCKAVRDLFQEHKLFSACAKFCGVSPSLIHNILRKEGYSMSNANAGKILRFIRKFEKTQEEL